MKTLEALRISRKKFSTRRGRSIFTAFTTSLGIILIAVVLMATGGVLSFIKDNFKDSFSGQPYVIETRHFDSTCDGTVAKCVKPFTLEELAEEYPGYNFKSLGQYPFNTKYEFVLEENLSKDVDQFSLRGNYIKSIDEFYIQDFLYGDYSFEDKYDGKVPVVLPLKFITNNTELNNLSDEEKFNKTKELVDKYIGTSHKLFYRKVTNPQDISNYEGLEVEVIIVGFSNSFLSYDNLNSMVESSVVIPKWAENSDAFKSFFENPSGLNSLVEFENVEERSRFMEEYMERFMENIFGDSGAISVDASTVEPMEYSFSGLMSRYFIIEEFLKVASVLGLAAGGFLLVISSLFTLTTIGKLVDDSKKEIGVFRAFGALKSDIRKIYYGYALILINLGILLGFSIAFIINTILSLGFGSRVYYSLINLGNNYSAEQPLLLFVSFPILELLAVMLVINILGILAAVLPVRKATKIDPIIVMRDE